MQQPLLSLGSSEWQLPSLFAVRPISSHLDLGAAYGTCKSGIGISTMGVLSPDAIVKSIVPVVMAGILGIYGLIIAVILLQKVRLSLTLDQLDRL